jgi:hypothetical protein
VQHAANSRLSNVPDEFHSHQEASPSTTLEPNAAVAHAVSDDLQLSPRRSVMELEVSTSLGEVPASGNGHAGTFGYHFSTRRYI